MTNFTTFLLLIPSVCSTLLVCFVWADITNHHFPKGGFRDMSLNFLYAVLCVIGLTWFVVLPCFTLWLLKPASWYIPAYTGAMVLALCVVGISRLRNVGFFRTWSTDHVCFSLALMCLALCITLTVSIYQ